MVAGHLMITITREQLAIEQVVCQALVSPFLLYF